MEAFLHYLWASRRWARLVPTGAWRDLPIEVIDPGRLNYHAGPDFLEAQVRIGDIRWCGAVEIHRAQPSGIATAMTRIPPIAPSSSMSSKQMIVRCIILREKACLPVYS